MSVAGSSVAVGASCTTWHPGSQLVPRMQHDAACAEPRPAPWKSSTLPPDALQRAFPTDGLQWERGEQLVRRLLRKNSTNKAVVAACSTASGKLGTRAQNMTGRARRLGHVAQVICENARAGDLQVVVIGGSMTAGAGCNPGFEKLEQGSARRFPHQLACAWPHRLQQWLFRAFRLRHVHVRNEAMGAHSSLVWASELSVQSDEALWMKLLAADLVVAEMSVNDQGGGNSSGRDVAMASAVLFSTLLALPQRPAVVALEAVRGAFSPTGRTNFEEARAHCRAEHPYGTAAGQKYSAPSRLAFGPQNIFRWCDQWWMPPTWRAPVLAALRVPTVSYRDATWPRAAAPPLELPLRWWVGLSHPNGETHQLIADTVAYALDATSRRHCRRVASEGAASVQRPAQRSWRGGPGQLERGGGGGGGLTLAECKSQCVRTAGCAGVSYDPSGRACFARGDAAAAPPSGPSSAPPFSSPPAEVPSAEEARYVEALRRAFSSCGAVITTLAPPRDHFDAFAPSMGEAHDGPPLGWTYGEDVAGNGKPGWTAGSGVRAKALASPRDRAGTGGPAEIPRLVFRVRMHARQHCRVAIKFLRSYDPRMGRVEVRLQRRHSTPKSAHRWTIDAHWDAPYSTAHVLEHDVPEFEVRWPEADLQLALLPLSANESAARYAALDESLQRKLNPPWRPPPAAQRTVPSRFKVLAVSTCRVQAAA